MGGCPGPSTLVYANNEKYTVATDAVKLDILHVTFYKDETCHVLHVPMFCVACRWRTPHLDGAL